MVIKGVSYWKMAVVDVCMFLAACLAEWVFRWKLGVSREASFVVFVVVVVLSLFLRSVRRCLNRRRGEA